MLHIKEIEVQLKRLSLRITAACLSPEELKAAEAAEREFEQERRDSELARRLQEQLAGVEEGEEEDQRVAREAQVR